MGHILQVPTLFHLLCDKTDGSGEQSYDRRCKSHLHVVGHRSDIASMAYNMQVAFATTVVGLFAAAIGFVTQQVKQRWYLQDMTHLEFVTELLNEKQTER